MINLSDNIIQLNEDLIKHDLKDTVRPSVEEPPMPCPTKKLMNWSIPTLGYKGAEEGYKISFVTMAVLIRLLKTEEINL